jgi:hypothetical protein
MPAPSLMRLASVAFAMRTGRTRPRRAGRPWLPEPVRPRAARPEPRPECRRGQRVSW